MANPMIRIHNLETDEIIDREMTEEEFIEWETAQNIQAEKEATLVQQENEKAALLAKLGITAEEAALLLA